MNPFAWLRNAARNAVLGGIQDALEEAAPTLETITVKKAVLAIPDVTEAEAEESPAKKKKGGA